MLVTASKPPGQKSYTLRSGEKAAVIPDAVSGEHCDDQLRILSIVGYKHFDRLRVAVSQWDVWTLSTSLSSVGPFYGASASRSLGADSLTDTPSL